MKLSLNPHRTIPALTVVAAWMALLLPSAAAEGLRAETASRPDRITLSFRNQPVMVYEFAPDRYKPYVKELHTLRGENVLLDAPADHLHHHALMYGIKVNGVNFWEEISGSGVQRVIRTAEPELTTDGNGLPTAILRQELAWVPAADAFLPVTNLPALLSESRTLILTIDEKASEVALCWHSRFTVGNWTNTVALTGSSYHGLGMRFLRELDPVAAHLTPAGPPDLDNNRQEVSAHAWEAVRFDAPGRPATIALFGAPGNARGNPHFFAMRTPFAYLSATQRLDQEPLVYKAGETFEIRYLVTLYPEVKTAEALAARARRFAASPSP
jgi:hypothetical protein